MSDPDTLPLTVVSVSDMMASIDTPLTDGSDPMTGITEARQKIKAIDKRIDAVRAELKRRRPAFDEMSAFAWQRAWDSYPGLQGIEGSLYARRGHWQEIRNAAETKEWQAAERRARAAERKAARESQERFKASRHACPSCGYEHYATA